MSERYIAAAQDVVQERGGSRDDWKAVAEQLAETLAIAMRHFPWATLRIPRGTPPALNLDNIDPVM